MNSFKLQRQVGVASFETVATEAHDIALLAADFQQSRGHRKETLKVTVSEKLDSLLGFMLANFHGVPTSEMVQECFATHHPLTEERLSKLDERILPIVVLRELISVHDMPIDRRLLRHWAEFSERYRYAVI